MGEIRAAPPGQTCHQAGNHGHVAGQRPEQDNGLRAGGGAGQEVHPGMERGAGSKDFGADSEGCAVQGWVYVTYRQDDNHSD